MLRLNNWDYFVRLLRGRVFMNIDIKKLSPNLLNDFLFYFDNVAFADHEEWSGCYCVEPHLCEKIEKELPKGTKSNCRDYAVDFIKCGKLQGYLAYCDGEVAGWCNVNDKSNYEKIAARKELWTDEDNHKKIKSIMCFSVAPNMRKKGIAAKLLERICEDSLAENYDIVEAYPYKGEPNAFYYFSGPVVMYGKYGFSVFRELRHDLIVRKYL
jgi:GNAT superfamily N-acetyltransferase